MDKYTFDDMEKTYNPVQEKIVDMLIAETGNPNRHFFRVMVVYKLAQLASSLRTNVEIHKGDNIPVNVFAVNLAASGANKGRSLSILDDKILNEFTKKFEESLFPAIADANLGEMAKALAAAEGIDIAEAVDKIQKEYKSTGSYLHEFPAGTSPALKQLRHKLIMAKAGSLNMTQDEIGSTLSANEEILGTQLELYDLGRTGTKLIKETKDSSRGSAIKGRVPSNLLMFGSPNKLLDGAISEQKFLGMLEEGYARRCLFNFSPKYTKEKKLSTRERFKVLDSTGSDEEYKKISDYFKGLCVYAKYNMTMSFEETAKDMFADYIDCIDTRADNMKENQVLEELEMRGRFFKVVKIAGSYAFISKRATINNQDIKDAITLIEDSGDNFEAILKRERPYVRLAKYIADVEQEVTHVELVEDLTYFKGSVGNRNELLNMASAWAYGHNIVIRRIMRDGIEFIKGEKLLENTYEEMLFSYSKEMASGYKPPNSPMAWENIYKMCTKPDVHWCTHLFKDKHRKEDNAIAGFNMIVIDVDGEVSIEVAKELMSDYKFLIYTTKSHGKDKAKGKDRFRIIFPTSHMLKLSSKEFKMFMANIYSWLPFDSDEATDQRSRKWMSNDGEYFYNEGNAINVYDFMPSTKGQKEMTRSLLDLQDNGSLDKIQSWLMRYSDGNRNNTLLKYAAMLVDLGNDARTIESMVMEYNSKFDEPVSEKEIFSTVMKTVFKKIGAREDES